MGFDIGAVLGNLLLAYFSQPGHPGGSAYAEWILGETIKLHEMFEAKFLQLWNSSAPTAGEGYKSGPFPPNSQELKAAQSAYLKRIFKESIGFAGAKMIRRIIGKRIVYIHTIRSIHTLIFIFNSFF